jgi:hypothetical protein
MTRCANTWDNYIFNGMVHDTFTIISSNKDEKLVIYKILWLLYKYIAYYNIQLEQSITKYESLIKLLKYNNLIQQINYINSNLSLNLINDTNICKLKIEELKNKLAEIKLIYNYYLRLFNYT